MGPRFHAAALALLGPLAAASSFAAPIYLNEGNVSVTVGSGTSAGTFNNTFDGGATIGKVVDASSASAEEFHDQSTHIWFTANEPGGGLELQFDFGAEYDIHTLHFWNYTSEDYDVDSIAFTFFNDANTEIGSLTIAPALGSSPGIRAEDIALAAPLNVRYVTAFLSGSNRQVDFQNIGFTADMPEPEPVPEPTSLGLLALGLLVYSRLRARTRNLRSV